MCNLILNIRHGNKNKSEKNLHELLLFSVLQKPYSGGMYTIEKREEDRRKKGEKRNKNEGKDVFIRKERIENKTKKFKSKCKNDKNKELEYLAT